MDQQTTSTAVNIGEASPRELFALTDEQILEIEPVAQGGSASPADVPEEVRNPKQAEEAAGLAPRATERADSASSVMPTTAEPPPWLAEMMDDPQAGGEARDLWNGIQQTQHEAAAYREVFAKPEDARALKDLYPGGVEQARAAAERARTLEEIDAAFYGGAGKSPEQLSAGRTALAQRMLREDPVAFREMVFAGLRELEAAGRAPNNEVAEFRTTSGNNASAEPQSGAAVSRPREVSGAGSDGRSAAPAQQQTPSQDDGHMRAYASFEKSANEELERSVGGAIQRALQQALPKIQVGDNAATGRTRSFDSQGKRAVTLQERLGGAIREDVESALKGDRQLGEQLAQVLSTRRFDDATRAQVVRLINERAQQLVPGAAKRVLQDWTQTAFASHRARTQSGADAIDNSGTASHFPGQRSRETNQGAAARGSEYGSHATSVSAKAAAADRAEKSAGLSPRASSRPSGRLANVDYRRLSDEQILEL